ncbi:BNR repeat-containing protein [Verrucomicrobiota bacterium]
MNESITVLSQLDIAEVPGGFPVLFTLLTAEDRQFVAYYDKEHRMTVAARALDEDEWQTRVLPEKVGWDNHNYVTIAADRDGYLHLSGNMHVVPLVYFRTMEPWDITTFERARMVGKEEGHCTYPNFFYDQHQKLHFRYRDGGCGDSVDFVNVYDCDARTWSRLREGPMFDGEKARTAYPGNPILGPDGWFHIVWVWREEPECETTHDPGYARSRDLIDWETIDGTPIHGPITFQHRETIIDPIPVNAGLINGSLSLGFDSRQRPLALYHKFDEHGNTQAYVARFERGAWVPHQLTDWDYRWEFQGRGGIIFRIRLAPLRAHAPGQLAFRFEHAKYGRGLCILDEDTLERIEIVPDRFYPEHLCSPQSDDENMQVWWREDSNAAATAPVRHVLRWETLPHNRDKKPDVRVLPTSMLRLYTFR